MPKAKKLKNRHNKGEDVRLSNVLFFWEQPSPELTTPGTPYGLKMDLLTLVINNPTVYEPDPPPPDPPSPPAPVCTITYNYTYYFWDVNIITGLATTWWRCTTVADSCGHRLVTFERLN